MNAPELEFLIANARALHETLRGMADFRKFPALLDCPEPEVQSYLDHVVAAVRDARALNEKIIEALESAPPEATADSVAAPIQDQPEEPRSITPEPLEQITMANPTGMREVVLVAESSARILQEVEEALTDYDFRVISVQDGFEAIATYGRVWTAIDLVVLDFDLPGLSGELIFEELLAINPHAAVVVSSGASAPEKGKFHQMLARGLSGFLPKPFERERLLRQIESILRRRPARP